MKAIKIYIVIAISTAFLTLQSCKVDEIIKDTPTQINNQEDATTVINGLYSQLGNTGGFKYEGMLMLMLSADDLYSATGADFGTYAKRQYNSVNTDAMWNTLYLTIANANNLISVLDKGNFGDAFEKRAYGDAYFIRAFCYYYLVRLYGGVPVRIQATVITSNFYLSRSSIDDVYSQIFSDFKKASDRLPLKSNITAAQLGRASKGAAQALLAHAYLTYGNQLNLKGQSPAAQYQNTVLYSDSVIASGQYLATLTDNYGDVFDITKETSAYSNEVIFGLRFTNDPQRSGQSANGSEFAYRFGAANTHFVSGNPNNGAGGGDMLPMPWIADYYRKGDYATTGTNPVIDYRNEKAFNPRGLNSVQNKFYVSYPNLPGSTNPGSTADGTMNFALIGKYIDPAGNEQRDNGNDFFIIRMAEVYLIKAEAQNELTGPALAVAPFNIVRARARKANGTARAVPADIPATTTLTKDQFRLKIFDERGLELIAEGQRWFDLVRMRSPLSASETMYEYQFTKVLNDATKFPRTLPTYQAGSQKYSNANAVYAPALAVTVPKFLLFPVPTNEINQNPKFGSQNPGW